MRKLVSILSLGLLLLYTGSCVDPLNPAMTGPAIELTLICDDVPETKARVEGEEYYNENLFSWVDFFFYEGLDEETQVYHLRKTSGETKKALFNINVSGALLRTIFPDYVQNSEAKVFIVANYPSENELYGVGLSLSELKDLVVSTDFVNLEDDHHRQPHFLMSCEGIVKLSNPNGAVVASEEFDIQRNACKIAASIFLKDEVEVQHEDALPEIWIPLKADTEIYLVNGLKTVHLSGNRATPATTDYFDYKNKSRKYVKADGVTPIRDTSHREVTYFDTETYPPVEYTVDQVYYNSDPMYTCPQSWSGTTQEQEPYLKLIVTWVRLERNGYDQISRQYYYKILIPDDESVHEDGLVHKQQFVRNNFYHYFIDVGILGSDTDDGRVQLLPKAVIAPWESTGSIEKFVEIMDARYLSVDRDTVILRNISSLVQLGYTSSHAIYIDSIIATRPYYGESKSGSAQGGTIKQVTASHPVADYPVGSYYLEYALSYDENSGKVEYTNKGTKVTWMTDTGTSIDFQHALNNNYKDVLFDYSPYTIHFRLIHLDKKDKDRAEKLRFSRTITVIQYPGIYIRAWANSDNTLRKIEQSDPLYENQEYDSDHWGYVLIDGGKGIENENRTRVRPSKIIDDSEKDDFFGIKGTDYTTSDAQKEELQWRTVWYTGGSVNLFKIDVTVLPEGDDPENQFVIGDPRTNAPVNLNYHETPEGGKGYHYIPTGDDAAEIWTSNYYIPQRDGFANSPTVKDNGDGTLSPDMNNKRTLTYYYPTESSDRTKNMLAPSYMIASKFGGTEYGGNVFRDVTKEYAEYRCAAYQEDGFPAGRWRLPTKAEIRFIAQLSANKIFTFLFAKEGQSAVYWSANGAVRVDGSGVHDVTNPTALLRCVYDTWYWGEEQLKPEYRETFVWGDKE